MHIKIYNSNNTTIQKSLPKRLYKYLDYDGAISMIRNNTIRFTNPKDWENTDPYEKKAVCGKYVINDCRLPYPLANNVYLACFTEQYSCEAQWKAYQRKRTENPCVEIQFDFQRLIDAFRATDSQLAFGKVNYVESNAFTKSIEDCFKLQTAKKAFKNYTKYPTLHNFMYVIRPLFLKRIAYAYENEWRFALTDEDIYDEGTNVTIPDMLDAVERIIIGPCSSEKMQQVKSEISDMLKRVGKNIEICESHLLKLGKGTPIFQC